MEVEDLDLFAAAAVGWSWRQPEPGVTGEDGSSLDKVASARYCRMSRARWARREGIREEPVSLRLLSLSPALTRWIRAGWRCAPAHHDGAGNSGQGI